MKYLFPVLLSATFFLSSCGKMEAPIFNSVENFKVGKPGLATSEVILGLRFFNPNNTGARLKNAEGEAWLDSSYLGRFHVDSAIKIPPKSNFTVPVRLDLDMMQFITFTRSGFKDGEVMVKVKGSANVRKAFFSKKISLDYEGKQNLEKLLVPK